MKILTEEKLRKFIRDKNMDHEHNVLAGQLIEALEDVEFIKKDTLNPGDVITITNGKMVIGK